MLGICYYPEHWPQSRWAEDAQMMADLGLTYVRIGEFSWSRLEPQDGELCFDWLDTAIDTLCGAGLNVVLGTPTATPPKWLIDKWPEILPHDPETGHVRGFGSRRHYDFSSEIYLRESLRITQALAKRYGAHAGVAGWQTDNELCCHDTAVSSSAVALEAFRVWCRQKYQNISALNTAWGNVFWSMEYGDFSEIESPFSAVIETNPSHSLAYRRFSSDQVINYHNQMVKVIRRHSPDKFVTHNFIPMSETGVDNFALAAPLDFASYDNYPLARTEEHFSESSIEDFKPFLRTGHPDLGTYYQDQTRGLVADTFWVMEQQPGPANWAPNNPRPAPGMVRFWTLEAFAHGASCVCYFRWRQVPFGQEQMHAGLLRSDSSKTEAWAQIEQVHREITKLDLLNHKTEAAKVAIVTGAESFWVTDIEIQGQAYKFNRVQLSYYTALRELGLNVDFISVDSDFSGYSLILAPCLPILDEAFISKCDSSGAIFVFGPRSGSKTSEFNTPETLAPGLLQRIAPLRVLSIETLRAGCSEVLSWHGLKYQSNIWREELDATNAEVLAHYEDGSAAVLRYGQIIYQGSLTDSGFLKDFLKHLCHEQAIKTYDFGKDIRVRKRGDLLFAFNYSQKNVSLALGNQSKILLGSKTLSPGEVTVWMNETTLNN